MQPKWTDESFSKVDSSVHLFYHDPRDIGSLILIRIISKECTNGFQWFLIDVMAAMLVMC